MFNFVIIKILFFISIYKYQYNTPFSFELKHNKIFCLIEEIRIGSVLL